MSNHTTFYWVIFCRTLHLGQVPHVLTVTYNHSRHICEQNMHLFQYASIRIQEWNTWQRYGMLMHSLYNRHVRRSSTGPTTMIMSNTSSIVCLPHPVKPTLAAFVGRLIIKQKHATTLVFHWNNRTRKQHHFHIKLTFLYYQPYLWIQRNRRAKRKQ